MQAWKRSARQAVAGLGLALVSGLTIGAGPAAPGRDYGFLVTSMGMQFHQGKDEIDCPQGRSLSARESFLASQPAAEQLRLSKPENRPELERKFRTSYVFGAGGKDICTDADLFDTPDRIVQKTVQSKIGPGMDLDGGDGASSGGGCGHDTFTSPSGEASVDNQFFRAIGCNTAWRGVNGGKGDFLGETSWVDDPVVMVVRGVESWTNDPEVEVLLAASPDRAPQDNARQVVDGGSLRMTQNPRYRVSTRGRIENGVLTTRPVNLVLPRNWVGASGGEFIMNHARIRVRLNAQGELVGQAGGYRPIDNAIGVMHVGGPGVADTAGVECASVRKTLRLLADGDLDPKTGQCTSVSTGLNFHAKPAFVFDSGRLVAAADGGARPASR